MSRDVALVPQRRPRISGRQRALIVSSTTATVTRHTRLAALLVAAPATVSSCGGAFVITPAAAAAAAAAAADSCACAVLPGWQLAVFVPQTASCPALFPGPRPARLVPPRSTGPYPGTTGRFTLSIGPPAAVSRWRAVVVAPPTGAAVAAAAAAAVT